MISVSVSLVKQLAVFEKQIVLSEEKQLPLIIHCVHAVNEIIQLKEICSAYALGDPWLSGKEELALQCVNHHIFLSFGEKYNEEALKGIPLSLRNCFTQVDRVLPGRGADAAPKNLLPVTSVRPAGQSGWKFDLFEVVVTIVFVDAAWIPRYIEAGQR